MGQSDFGTARAASRHSTVTLKVVTASCIVAKCKCRDQCQTSAERLETRLPEERISDDGGRAIWISSTATPGDESVVRHRTSKDTRASWLSTGIVLRNSSAKEVGGPTRRAQPTTISALNTSTGADSRWSTHRRDDYTANNWSRSRHHHPQFKIRIFVCMYCVTV